MAPEAKFISSWNGEQTMRLTRYPKYGSISIRETEVLEVGAIERAMAGELS